ncbi:MAG: 30S ribosomal protein S5 [Planctomycetota bacterium]|nr:30S ribosomal protein S5 [Planctomycetota bacterium]
MSADAGSADTGSAEATPAPEKEAPAAEAPAEAPAKSEDAPAEAAPPRGNTGRPGGGGRFGGGRGGPGGGRGGPGGGRGGRGGRGGGRRGRDDGEESRYEERVVKINRCSKVIKGGRRFSFSALVVLGDREGNVGIGFGKANEVPPSVEKAMKIARKAFTKVSIHGNTIPHKIVGSYRSSRVVMLPATEGTGIIAGAPVRAVVECAGVKDLLTKVHGSTNPLNVVKATMNGLKQLRTREEVSMLRGVEIPE